jgi:hypothetical protein
MKNGEVFFQHQKMNFLSHQEKSAAEYEKAKILVELYSKMETIQNQVNT